MESLNEKPVGVLSKSPISELVECLQALHGSLSWAKEQNIGLAHELKWQVTVSISLPEKNPVTFKGDEWRRSKHEAKEDAALKALQDSELNLRKLKDVAQSPQRSVGKDCISLLHEYCQQRDIGVKLEDINEGQSSLGCKAILIWSNGDKRTFNANPPYLSLTDARRDAALLALEYLHTLSDHTRAMTTLLAQLSLNERRVVRPNGAQVAYALPLLAKVQKAREPLRDENGQALVEGRHLEFKALPKNQPPQQQWNGIVQSWIKGSEVLFEQKHVLVYISAYLNARIPGRIILGVHDTDGVQGIPMTSKNQDELGCLWAERVKQLWPPVPHGKGILREPYLLPVEHALADGLARFLIVFEVLPQPGPNYPYFWDKLRCRAAKKVENTVTLLPADELTLMTIAACNSGVSL